MKFRKQEGVTLLELMVVLAIGGAILLAVGSLVKSAMDTWNAGRAEAEARQGLEAALDQMEQAIRGASNVLVAADGILALDLDPTLDRNADGYPDADSNKNGLIDEEVRTLSGELLTANILPPDVTRDWAPGIKDVDDDRDGKIDWADETNNQNSNNETDLTYSATGFTTAWEASGPDWLDVVLFEQVSNRLRMSLPQLSAGTAAGSSGNWTRHVILENLVSMTVVKRAKGSGNRAMDVLRITLCVSVPGLAAGATARPDMCAYRQWRVGAPL